MKPTTHDWEKSFTKKFKQRKGYVYEVVRLDFVKDFIRTHIDLTKEEYYAKGLNDGYKAGKEFNPFKKNI